MAKLDFPSSPTPSQKYPSPAVAGQPVYTWDGEKWTSIASQYVPGTAPYDAMAYSGIQINGGMEVSQERGTTAILISTGAGDYIVDGWMLLHSSSQTISCQQQPTALQGFSYQIGLSVAVANPAPAAGHYCSLVQRIEGYRMSRLAWGTASAQPITIGFWVYTNRAGTYSGSVSNTVNRFYTFPFTVSAATWEYKTVTIPGDTTGTWAKDNTIGMQLSFSLMVGSTYQGLGNTWSANNYLGVVGTTNGVAATSDLFVITGVTVHPGTQGPTAAQSPNIMRPRDQELITCMRYYEADFGQTVVQSPAASSMISLYTYKVVKRTAPTVSFIGVSGTNASTVTSSITTHQVGIQTVSTAAGGYSALGMVMDARL